MKRIALDCMGGDHGASAMVQGAVEAAREWGLEIILVGDEQCISRELVKYPTEGLKLEILHTTEVITADDQPGLAVRRKKDSSLVVASRLVKEGRAQAVFSAGNTGAIVAAGLLVIGRMAGVERPALAPVLPTTKDHGVLLLDVGANVECKPSHLYQYGIMGSIYAERVLGITGPRVALLNVGAEEGKGSELYKDAHTLLKEAPVKFVGNIEARELPFGSAHVVVCDGFVGNVVLKFMEGLAHAFTDTLREEMTRSWLSSLAAGALKPSLRRFKKRLDYTEYGGAPMLGINGACFKGHGSSNAKAVKNGLRVAHTFLTSGAIERLRESLDRGKDGKDGETT